MKNVTGIACFLLLSVGFGALSWCQEPADARATSLVDAIASKNESQRRDAKDDILKVRSETVQGLIRIVDDPVKDYSNFHVSGTPRNTAIFLLGELRAEEAIPSLLEWIAPPEGEFMVIDAPRFITPAGDALAKIGMPAVDPLLDRVKTKGPATESLHCLIAMGRILTADLAEAKLEKALAAEENEEYRKNIQHALNVLKKENIRDRTLERPW